MSILTGRWVNLLLRLLLGCVFVFAAWDKVLHPMGFAMSVRAYKIIPFAFSNFFALAVSWSELAAGIMLLLGVLSRKAAGALLILVAMFTIAILTVLIRGMVIDCGCFGTEGGATTSWLLILRDVGLLIAAYLVAGYNDGFLCLFPGSRALETPDHADRY